MGGQVQSGRFDTGFRARETDPTGLPHMGFAEMGFCALARPIFQFRAGSECEGQEGSMPKFGLYINFGM